MYAKAILVADAPTDLYQKVVGLPIEIVPEMDPYRLKPGESLPIRMLVRGKPAGNLEIRAASTNVQNGKTRSVGRTGPDGRISIPAQSGKWRLQTIYMERSSNRDADWESLWATLTFEVP